MKQISCRISDEKNIEEAARMSRLSCFMSVTLLQPQGATKVRRGGGDARTHAKAYATRAC